MRSIQQELPKARVNIALDVVTNGAQKKTELPFKLLVLGDYGNNKSAQSLSQLKRVNVNKYNFNQVLGELAPHIRCSVPNRLNDKGGDLLVDVCIDDMSKFHPDCLIHEIPELKRLIAMRHLLGELRANLIDNNQFRKKLESMVKERNSLKTLRDSLKTISEGDTVDQKKRGT